MLGQRVVENFFKRAKFRRSKRARGSFRSSSLLRKEAKMAASNEDNKPTSGKCSREQREEAVRDSENKPSNMSATSAFGEGGGGGGGRDSGQPLSSTVSQHSTTKQSSSTDTNGVDAVHSTAEIISTSHSECATGRNGDLRSEHPCCTGSSEGQVSSVPNPTDHSVSSQSLCGRSLSTQQQATGQPSLGQSFLSEPTLSLPSAASDVKVIEDLRKEVAKLKRELSTSQEMLCRAQEREKQLRNRLSEQAQRQLQKGSSRFEDLSLGESRPTQLIKRYGNLYTESRFDAMDSLDDIPNMADCEDLKVKLLLSVIVLAFRSAEKTLTETKTKIRDLLHIPRVTESGNSSFCNAAKELEDAVAFYLRKTVDKHDTSRNYKEVCERVWTTLYDYPLLKGCHGLLRYVDDCVRIAWALTIQNPPFTIDYESCTYNPDTHSRFHTSDAESSAIKSVLWPVLSEGESGSCVSKGVVLT